MIALSNATEQQGGVMIRIDHETYTTPCEGDALACHKIFHRENRPFGAGRADFEVAEMKPEFAAAASKSNRDCYSIVSGLRLLDKADDLSVVGLQKP